MMIKLPMQSERLAIFLPQLHEGGAQRQMLNLARGIADRGYTVDLVLAKAEGPYLADLRKGLLKEKGPGSLQLVDLSGGRTVNRGRTVKSFPALVRYLRRRRPEAVLAVLNRAGFAAVWARQLARVSSRIVVSERNSLSHWAENRWDWRAQMTVQLTKRVYRKADAITAVSYGVAEDLSRVTNIGQDRIQVIYNPVITPALKQKFEAPFDHPWFGRDQPPVLLAVGRLADQKDYPTLIKAFAQLRRSHQARLMILGEGDLRTPLVELTRQLGPTIARDVSLPGWVKNPYPYMRRAAMFVLSSKFEGLPGVLIEALYCGVPLVATDCPSGPREILADGRYGQLVPVGDVTSLAQAMERTLKAGLVQNQEGEKPPPARDRWTRFEMDTVVDQYLQLLLGRKISGKP